MENRGFINLNSTVMVSDPCYKINTWCQGVLHNVLAGKYKCNIDIWDEGEWGDRVATIEVVHEEYNGILSYNPESFQIGVDSGQAGIFDYEYYKQSHADNLNQDWYNEVCNITSSRKRGGIINNAGFVSTSGYGDGGYTCYTCRDKNGYIIGIRIEFLSEENENEDE